MKVPLDHDIGMMVEPPLIVTFYSIIIDSEVLHGSLPSFGHTVKFSAALIEGWESIFQDAVLWILGHCIQILY